jgi:hypothetical protein
MRGAGGSVFTLVEFDWFVTDLEQEANLQIFQALHGESSS